VADENSAPYWSAAARHILALPCCSRCGKFTLPPDVSCPHCHSLEPGFRYEPVAGRGRVRTWTIVRRSFLAGFNVPFVLVDVQLDDQPHVRMIGRLLDGIEAPICIGARVVVAFEDLSPVLAVPAFTLADAV
jgi:uncharacterized protein